MNKKYSIFKMRYFTDKKPQAKRVKHQQNHKQENKINQ